ncbi:MAG: tRNA (N6-isopentenyl adenosine(37)-C2)-methylthiotransferase MiaB [Flavobacteriales bacterium]|nr:tRNA (N6-isopentenyl adenosine(37)-C2)-methylthiotransferase MiaB [Flavobacteriales bacterium]
MLISENKVIDETRQGEATVLNAEVKDKKGNLYLESYGCQMNFSDSEIVASVMAENGYATTQTAEDADVIFLNTCAIRENAEQRVRKRLSELKALKKEKPHLMVGVLGCMAERLKEKFLEEEKLVDLVVGPDAYRDLPALVERTESGSKSVNVLLSLEETYADINPVRLTGNGISAFISIMRGCDNMCSFCVVPFTRGRERSRDPESIMKEARELFEAGYREITLLGQNVDSYLWFGGGPKKEFKLLSDEEKAASVDFADLLKMTAEISPELRVRFTTSHPRDLTDKVLHAMAAYDNICKYIHLPVQSGNTRVLSLMNRGYSREWYMDRVEAVRRILPDCALSTDIITGFCTETDEEHKDTLSLMEWAAFDYSYMFKYSERPKTPAERKYTDDIPEEVKTARLTEVIQLQNRMSLESNKKDIGKVFEVLVEGPSKKSVDDFCGRNSQNKMIVFPKGNAQKGQYVKVKVNTCTSATLIGELV